MITGMKRVLVIVIGILLLLAIPVTVFFVGQRQEIRKRAAPATSLTLTPQTNTKKVGDKFTVEVQIDTGTNQVTQATLHILFDASLLQADSITQGPLFPKIYLSGVVNPGSASITVGATSTTQPITGTGTAAILQFTALKATTAPATISFANDTFVGGLGEEKANVLSTSSPANVTILTAGGEALSTPTPTTAGSAATVSPTPSPIPTIVPTITGTVQNSTTSGLAITEPANNAEITGTQPTIKGTASPSASVTVVVYSDPVTGTVTADGGGQWSFAVPVVLPAGAHSVVATSTDPVTGQAVSTSSAFTIAAQASEATGSALPTSGTFETTLLLIGLSVFLIIGGLAVPVIFPSP